MTGERINVGSFSKDWKGSKSEIFGGKKKGPFEKSTLEVQVCRYSRSHSQ